METIKRAPHQPTDHPPDDLRSILCTSLGLHRNGLAHLSDMEAKRVFDLLTLKDEDICGTDQHGRTNEQLLGRDPAANEVDELVGTHATRSGFRVLFTHDVDRVTTFELTSLAKSLFNKKIDGYPASLPPATVLQPARLHENLEEMIQLEKRHGINSWFFMLSGKYGVKPFENKYDIRSKHARKFIETIVGNGCHLGLHGSYLARDKNSYKEEAHLLSELSGKKITAHRNHYLRFDRHRIWNQMEHAGITHDFSVGYVNHAGFRAGTCRAYNGIKPGGPVSTVTEIPLIFLERNKHLVNIEATLQELDHLLEKTKKYNGTVSILFHPENFLLHKKWWELYEKVILLCKSKNAITDGSLKA